MTTTTTLTDRYVHATLRTVPEAKRADLREELRASIDDMVEARVADGEPADVAERAVLTELGDPDALAGQYADRPLHLIGPRYFLTYWRLLLKLLIWIPASVGLVVLTVSMITSQGGNPEGAVGDGVSAFIQTALHVAFWTTLAFAVLERVDVDPGLPAWTVDALPEAPGERRITMVDTVASVVFILFFGAVLVLQHFRSWIAGPDGDDVPVLDPDLWSGWLPFLLLVLLASAALEVWKYRAGRWTVPIGVTASVLAVAFAAPLGWLGGQELRLSPAFVDAVGMSEDVQGWVRVGLVSGAVVLALVEVADAAWRVRRDRLDA